ncbi:MAG: hypothetical protein M1828_002428 [Chrysothrix sp. TS-e1954]|nr:MAG: hypothetical protein M1828_002428 [Chrysothrix sp. TS-e1954]
MSIMRFALPVLAASGISVGAVSLDVNDPASIRNVSASIVSSIFQTYYDADSTCGNFKCGDTPWEWWLSGAVWTGMMDYQTYTGDASRQSDVLSAIEQNVGTNDDFFPAEQTDWVANDDQAFWAFNALTALEYSFPPLPCSNATRGSTAAPGSCPNSYLSIAANVFSQMVTRWTNASSTCSGGLPWQLSPTVGPPGGFNYKNSVSSGGFFNIASRLARYTGNTTYSDWATKIWVWQNGVDLMSPDFHVYDGAGDANGTNCSTVDKAEWTYNSGLFMYGAAAMHAFNATDGVWEQRVQGLLNTSAQVFFSPFDNATYVMYEHCELDASCDQDQVSFKAYLARWMAKSTVLVPAIKTQVIMLLSSAAKAAATSCAIGNGTATVGNATGDALACGSTWWQGGYDGKTGLGEMLSALEVVQGLLVSDAPALASAPAS